MDPFRQEQPTESFYERTMREHGERSQRRWKQDNRDWNNQRDRHWVRENNGLFSRGHTNNCP